MNLYLSFARATKVWANREALVDGKKRFTYKQFGERVAALSNFFLELGVVKGSVVGMMAPNGHEFMEAYYACAILGIVLNPINFRLSSHEVTTILNDSSAQIVVCHTDFSQTLKEALKNSDTVRRVIWIGEGERVQTDLIAHDYESSIAKLNDKPLPECTTTDTDLAQLYYTSGTTGRAKGVMLSQANVTFHALGAVAELQLNDGDTWAHVAPMFHLADAWSIFSVTWAGGKHVFLPYFDAEKALDLFEKERVTITVMVPTMVNALLNSANLSRGNYESLRLILTAGSPIAPENVKRIVNAFGCDYLQFYGMTETSPFLTISTPKAHLRDLPLEKKLELISRTGRPFIGVELKVVRPDGTEVKPDDLDVGEIVVRGPGVTQGYWNQPQATADTIRDGWLHTGDLASIDAEGYVNIVDRAKDMIISGGENIYSTEVEYVLYEHSSVMECAVFGIPDPKWGESVKAVIVPRHGVEPDEAELIAFVKSRLAGYKAPRSIDFVTELPKTGSGKIYKKGLKEKYWEAQAKKVN